MGETHAVPEGASPALTPVCAWISTQPHVGGAHLLPPLSGKLPGPPWCWGAWGQGRSGLDRPRLMSGTEFEFREPVRLLRASLALEQMGVPTAVCWADSSRAWPSKEAQAAIVLGKREALEKKNHQDMQHGTICFTKSLLFITAAIAPGTMLAPVLRQVLPPCASVSPSIRWG